MSPFICPHWSASVHTETERQKDNEFNFPFSDDAKEVVAYHTDTRLLGIDGDVGHTDHYVNGGQVQPECLKESILKEDVCSHRLIFHSTH